MNANIRKKSRLIPLGLILANLTLAQHARSAVIVYFEQVGSDVRVSWSGTLLSNAGDPNPNDNHNFSRVGPTIHLSDVSTNPTRGATVGVASDTGLLQTEGARTAATVGNWGFFSAFIYWTPEIVGAGTVNAPTRLDYDPTKQVFLLPDTTLAAINAGSFNNTLAWTANGTGDTIRYTTGPVPEPTSAMLLALAGSSLLLRRRRR